MNVNQAVRTAKEWIREIYSDEDVTQLGLEEVQYDEEDHEWRITLGFARPWNSPRTNSTALAVALGEAALKRIFKVVVINDSSGHVISLKNRAEV